MDRLDWPGDDAARIAMAGRIVLLSAASRARTLTGLTADDRDLLATLASETMPDRVDGSDFAGFLTQAQAEISRRAPQRMRRRGQELLRAVTTCEPYDLIGSIYDALVGLVDELYGGAIGNPTPPDLHIDVLDRGPLPVSYIHGMVPRSRRRVMLSLHTSFDLKSLALLPYILAHELICHAGARSVGEWEEVPKPYMIDLFEEGFMDNATWWYVQHWIYEGVFPESTPVGYLAHGEGPYTARRPQEFEIGKAAWWACLQALGAGRRGRTKPTQHDPPEAVLVRTALALNATEDDVRDKDAFVYWAHEGHRDILRQVASVAGGDATPQELFATARRLRGA